MALVKCNGGHVTEKQLVLDPKNKFVVDAKNPQGRPNYEMAKLSDVTTQVACNSEQQDKIHGDGWRIANPCRGGEAWRCTNCGRVHYTLKEEQVVEDKKKGKK